MFVFPRYVALNFHETPVKIDRTEPCHATLYTIQVIYFPTNQLKALSSSVCTCQHSDPSTLRGRTGYITVPQSVQVSDTLTKTTCG